MSTRASIKRHRGRLEGISHFFLSTQCHQEEIGELTRIKEDTDTRASLPSTAAPSLNAVGKKSATTDSPPVFSGSILRSDCPEIHQNHRSEYSGEKAQDNARQPQQRLSLRDFLPEAREGVDCKVKSDVEPPESAIYSKETILLIDDSAPLLELGREILGNHGYRVLAAQNREDALKLYENQKNHIDVVVLDLVMPGIGWIKCLEELLRMRSDARVIVSSSVEAGGLLGKAIEAGAKSYIRKPYHFSEMIEEIRKVVEGD
jgi:CheY-like chemotaxis protein